MASVTEQNFQDKPFQTHTWKNFACTIPTYTSITKVTSKCHWRHLA